MLVARPLKDGVDYWPFDVDFLRDKKMKLIKAEFGIKGAYIALELLNSVYATNGYFKSWDEDDCLLMSEGVGDGCSPKLVDEVLQGCLRRSLFDQGVYQMFSVLTSPGIQRRFLRIVGNSRPDIRIFKEYWLLDTGNKKDVPASVLGKLTFENVSRKENSVKSKDNPLKSTGNQESKEKKSKEERYICAREGIGNLKQVSAYFEGTFGRLIGGKDRDIIVRIAGEYDPDLSLCAIRLAKERNANSAAYVLSILERWKAQGVTHIDQVKKQNQNAVTKKSAPPDYTDPALYQEEGDLDAVFGRYDPKNKG